MIIERKMTEEDNIKPGTLVRFMYNSDLSDSLDVEIVLERDGILLTSYFTLNELGKLGTFTPKVYRAYNVKFDYTPPIEIIVVATKD